MGESSVASHPNATGTSRPRHAQADDANVTGSGSRAAGEANRGDGDGDGGSSDDDAVSDTPDHDTDTTVTDYPSNLQHSGAALSRTTSSSQHRRTSFVASTSTRGALVRSLSYPHGEEDLTRSERAQSREDERTLFGDAMEASETSRLLSDGGGGGGGGTAPNYDDGGLLKRRESLSSTWQHEAKVLVDSSKSLILTFLLQYSLTVASIVVVGRIGKRELGAVSLASMTANITGYVIYQGLATSLDTLCAEAYGSGRKKLVGVHLQRMVVFLFILTIPISVVWLFADKILQVIIPEKDVAALAGLYLKVLIFGAPGYAAFESGKRYLQAQGLFSATLFVLLFCAPLNAFLNWYFVWCLGWGFIGAPTAVAIVNNLMPLGLVLYVRFVAGLECWDGLTSRAFTNWGPMIRLAVPGLIMLLAEFLAFEITTLSSSYMGSTQLASQSVVSTISALSYYIPFPVSIAATTRIANLIGANLPEAAKMTAKVTVVASALIGLVNFTFVMLFRRPIATLFTNDDDVIDMVVQVLPIVATGMLFDATGANVNGILRGLGRQEVGGYVNLFAYYVVALPVSMGLGFGLHLELRGFWTGTVIALFLVTITVGIFVYRADWDRSVENARKRNETA